MYYNAEDILNGLTKYIDNDILPALDTKGKIIVGTVITLGMQKADNIIKSIPQNEVFKMFGVVDDNGMYDIDSVADSLKANMDKYGKMEINIPVLGTLKFSGDDVVRLKQYIKGELS